MRETMIVGVGMTPFGRFPAQTLAHLAQQAAAEALEDAAAPRLTPDSSTVGFSSPMNS